MPGRVLPKRFSNRTSPLPFSDRVLPLDFSKLAKVFPNFIALVEIDFDTGTEYFSFEGVGAPSRYYEDLVESIGQIEREAPVLGGEYRTGDVQVSFINDTQYFSKKKGGSAPGKYFYNRTLRISFGDSQDGIAAMEPIFTGKITKWNITEGGRFIVQARDISYDRFRQAVTGTMKTLTSTNFPNLPAGSEPRLVPVVYGDNDVDPDVNLATYDQGGPVPCYLINTNAAGKWRYIVAQHVCKSITNMFVYGVKVDASTYTAVTVTYAGISMTAVDFNSDPRVTSRSGELEVTAAVKGITNTGQTTGTLLDDPVDVIEHYLLNYGGCSAGELDATQFDTATDVTVAGPYKAAFAVVDRQLLHADIIARWSESFLGSFFVTRSSKFAVFVKSSASPSTPVVLFTADLEMIDDTFEVGSNEAVASTLQYNWFYHWVRDYFGKQPDYAISGQSTALGATIRKSVSLWFVRESATALLVVASYSQLYKEEVEYQKFELTPDQFLVVDLNGYVGLTHWQGVASSGGYSAVTARVFSVSLQPTVTAENNTEMKIGARSVKIA